MAAPVNARAQLGAARRVVVKVGSSSLTSLTGGLDPQRLDALVDALAARRATGSQVVLVSSGAIAAGLAPLGLARRPRDLATQQAAAAVGQLQLAQTYGASFARHGQLIGQVLLTADDMIRRAHYRNAQRTLERLLGLDVLPVVNENDTVATDEIRVGDNDRLAALVAHIVGADGLVLLSDVDGLYDGDPRRPGARLVAEVDEPADLAAVTIARPGAARPRHRRDGHQDHRRGHGVRGRHPGAARRGRGRRRRARHGRRRAEGRHGVPPVRAAHVGAHGSGCATPRTCTGRLDLDRGATTAVLHRRRSLLAAGIRGVSGDFVAGDVVDLVDPDGTVVARGVVGFDATELPELIGRSSHELPPEQRREVVHADDLVTVHIAVEKWRDAGPALQTRRMGAADRARARLVDGLRDSGRLCSAAVEEAFRTVPRHLFLPGVPLARAYADEAVAVQAVDGVTTSSASQPSMMAIMLAQLDLRPGHRVLEIGAGTGYNAALMARIVGPQGHVVAVDIDEELVDGAARHLAAAGVADVELVCGDGALGHAPGAPYDRIILTVGSGDVRPEWIAQLAPGGRLLLPLALRGTQLSVALDLGADGALRSASVHRCCVRPAAGCRRDLRDGRPVGGGVVRAAGRRRRPARSSSGRHWPRPDRAGTCRSR